MPTATPTDDYASLCTQELAERLRAQDKLGDSGTCKCGRPTVRVTARLLGWPQHNYTTVCDQCDPAVAALKAQNDRAFAEQRRQMNEQRLLAEIGEHHAACTVASYVATTPSQQEALEAIQGQWWKRQTFLLLCGNPGTGKTHLSVAAYRQALDDGQQPTFIGETQFLHDWRRAAAQRMTFDGVEALMSAPILILDDIGTGKYTDGSLEILYQIIDHRSRYNVPTMMTSNLPLEGLDTRWGEKIVSRITERGRAKTIVIAGPNHRLKAA